MSVTLYIPEIPEYSIYPFTGQYESVYDMRKKIPIHIITDTKKTKVICVRSVNGSDIVLKFYKLGYAIKSSNEIQSITVQITSNNNKSVLFVKSHNRFDSMYEKDIIKAISLEAKRLECHYIDLMTSEDIIYNLI